MEYYLAQIQYGLEILFSSAVFESFVFWGRTIGTIVSLLLLAGILFAAVRMNAVVKKTIRDLAEALRTTQLPKRQLARRFEKIKARLEKRSEAEQKLAVIEADKMVNEIFEYMGYKGQTLADKLKQIKKGQLESLEDLWAAHKVRNAILHDPEYSLSELEAQQTISRYQAVLRELEVID